MFQELLWQPGVRRIQKYLFKVEIHQFNVFSQCPVHRNP